MRCRAKTVEVEDWRGHPDRRRLLRVEVASSERIVPICPHFGVCGGCAVQHWDWDRYRAWKRDLVVSALAQAGIAAEVDDLVDAHGEGRRRVVLHARRGTHDVLEVGFAALHAHTIVPIDRCPVAAPGLDGAIEAAWAIAEALRPTAKPLDIHATATETGLDIDVRGSGPLAPQEALALAHIAEAHRLARLTRHGELIAQRATPTVTMGRASVAIPPGAFLQATAEGEAQLAHLVLRHVGDAKAVADLFAGVGPFALRLAERARVVGGGARRGRGRGAPSGGAENARPQAGERREARSLPPPLACARARGSAARRRRIRSAAPGRRRAGAARLRQATFPWSSPSRAIPRPSHAMRRR